MTVTNSKKILILNPIEKFSNHFEYNRKSQLVQSSNRGAFDNIFNYRIGACESKSGKDFVCCSLLVKYLILIRVGEESQVVKTDLDAWLQALGFNWESHNLDQKILVRAGLLVGEFDSDSNDLVFSETPKAKFLMNSLLEKYTYFERACTRSRMPNFIRRNWCKVSVTSGVEWGLASTVNVALVLSYVRFVEAAMQIPVQYCLADRLTSEFKPIVRRVVAQGLSSGFSRYKTNLETAFRKALS